MLSLIEPLKAHHPLIEGVLRVVFEFHDFSQILLDLGARQPPLLELSDLFGDVGVGGALVEILSYRV